MKTPLRVALDGGPLLGTRTGVGQVADDLLSSLNNRADVEARLFLLGRAGTRLADLRRHVGKGTPVGTLPLPARVVAPSWRRFAKPPIEWWTGPVNVVHGLNFVAPPARAPTLITIHDLAFARFPKLIAPSLAGLPNAVRQSLDRGAHVHATTDFVAREVEDILQVGSEKIHRVHLGLPHLGPGDAAAGQSQVGAGHYVLSLGTVEPRKNLPVLVRAFDRVAQTDPDVRLVVAGPDGWGTEQYDAAVAAATHSARILRVGYLSPRGRADVLAGASVLAYPSLYEGFGLPPLEAMSVGVPVVASTAGAIPEVLGDAATLVDPDDVDALAAAITQTLEDEGLRTRMAARGRARAQMFDWAKAADGLVDVYRSLA